MEKTIVKTDNYLLVVDDSEIKQGDWFYLDDANIIAKYNVVDAYPTKGALKISVHLPLNDSSVLEGVMLLPPFTHFEFEMEDELAIDGHTIIGRNPKTTTNSQGQEVACGKYVYAS